MSSKSAFCDVNVLPVTQQKGQLSPFYAASYMFCKNNDVMGNQNGNAHG